MATKWHYSRQTKTKPKLHTTFIFKVLHTFISPYSIVSWNNRNSFTTSRYWLEKVFLTLQGSQDSIVLSGNVWLDETFYRVSEGEIECSEPGKKLRGLSRNQYCIGSITGGTKSIFLVEGRGKPSQRSTVDAFLPHITPKSTLIHDGDKAQLKLIKRLDLSSKVYTTKSTKGLADKENPLYPINRQHALLKRFLTAHSSFDRSYLQGYLDLFAFVTNPPLDHAEKVEHLLNLAFKIRDYSDIVCCFHQNERITTENSNTIQNTIFIQNSVFASLLRA